MSDDERIKNQIQQKYNDLVIEKKVELFKDEVGFAEMTDKHEENKKINLSPIIWEKAWYDLFLELLDFDSGYATAKTAYTNMLLESGSHTNPQGVYQFLDLLTSRLEKIHIVKRLCHILGLQNEMDSILQHELNLIYTHPRVNQGRVVELGRPISGDLSC